MATPVVTPGDPSQYAQYQKQLNEIMYSKQQWQKGQQEGRKGLQDWASNNAQQYYSQLPAELAGYVKGLGMADMTNFYNSIVNAGQPAPAQAAPAQGPPPVDPNSPLGMYLGATNPWDQQVSDMLGKLKNYQAPVNPYDAQVAALLSELRSAINTPLGDPTQRPEYAAAQARNERAKGQSINDAAEVLGGSGLARSSIVTDRAQEIGQQFQEYMETQIIPGIVAQMQGEKDSKISGLGQLLGATSDQQKTMDLRNSEEYKRMGQVYDALVGQQGAFDQRIQNEFQNRIAQGGLDLETQTFEHQKKIDEANLKINEINAALQRTNTLGKVSAQDAAILGVPAGTPSFQAADAAAKRTHELEMQKKDNEAAMARVKEQNAGEWKVASARIAADKEIAKKSREQSASYEKARVLISIWDQTGSAPPGLEDLGVQPGTPKVNDGLTPGQLLDQMKLEEAKSLKADDEARKKNIPIIQGKFKTDKTTADAIYDLYDNPDRESAIADFNAAKADLRREGVNLKKIQEAIDDKWPAPAGEKKKTKEPIPGSVGDDSPNSATYNFQFPMAIH